MIKIYTGNIGSGKSLCAVREMALAKHMNYYSNILPMKPRLTPNIIPITPDMIVLKEQVGVKNKKDGSVEPQYEKKLNEDFWRNQAKRPLSVVLDEAHDFLNARRFMSKTAEIMSSFLAMARRIVGEKDAEGDLIFITQLDRRIDVICREMAHQVRHHVAHYTKACMNPSCSVSWYENSDMPEKLKECPVCGNWKLKKIGLRIEVMHFAGIKAYEGWKEFGMQTHHMRYFVDDAEKYYSYYDTMQWDNLFKEMY